MGWLLIIAIIVIWLHIRIMHRWSLTRIGYTRSFNVDRCYTGDEVELVETIVNRKFLPVPWVRLESIIHNGLHFQQQFNLSISEGQYYQNHKSFFSLAPYTRIKRRHQIRCVKRGCYRLESVTMTSGDILGISNVTRRLKLKAELIVYPRPLPIEEVPLPSHSWQGDVTVRRWLHPDPFMFAGIRDYQYGDTFKDINWKATARSGKMVVNQRDFTADHRLMIYVNVEVTEGMWADVTDIDLVEQAIVYAASIAQHAISLGIETGFGINGYSADVPNVPVRIEPAGGGGQLHFILENMAKLVIARSSAFDLFLQVDAEAGVSNTDFVLITTHVSERMQREIERLKENGNAVDIVPLADGIAELEGKPSSEASGATEAAAAIAGGAAGK